MPGGFKSKLTQHLKVNTIFPKPLFHLIVLLVQKTDSITYPLYSFSFYYLGFITLRLEYGFNNFVDDLIEILLFDTAETTVNITFDIAGENLALHETGL